MADNMVENTVQVADALKSSPQRSVTLPLRMSASPPERRYTGASSSNTQIERLFTHPFVRIVSFTTAYGWAGRSNSKNGMILEDEAGTLPWTSSIERLIAVGPLHIYRPHGSVAFLACGKATHPILPKSQCWCVDDDSSKFVLQIRRPQYWRIEVSVTDPEDLHRSEELKTILNQVLQFEKTVCPFKRSFRVELPEMPQTPVRKKPWRPVERSQGQKDVVQTQDALQHAEKNECCLTTTFNDGNGHAIGDSDSDATDATDDTNVTAKNAVHISTMPLFVEVDSINGFGDLPAHRSMTAPSRLTIITSTPPRAEKTSLPYGTSTCNDSSSPDYSSSVESFHTVQSWHSPITPLPLSPPESNPASPTTYPYPHDNIALPKRPSHPLETSELTVTPETPRVWEIMQNSRNGSDRNLEEELSSLTQEGEKLVNDIEEHLNEEHFKITELPVESQIRHRPTTGSNSRRRTLSPLPAPINLFSTPQRRSRYRQTVRHLPIAIIQKTCEILLSPPSHLLCLMLDIATKIAAGEWRGIVFGYDEEGVEIVGHLDGEDCKTPQEEWEEDDFGIDLSMKQGQRSHTTQERIGRSWEID